MLFKNSSKKYELIPRMTLIEWMIVFAISGIVVAIGLAAYERDKGRAMQNSSMNIINKSSFTRCDNGFLFVVKTGSQVLDENGKGVKCNG